MWLFSNFILADTSTDYYYLRFTDFIEQRAAWYPYLSVTLLECKGCPSTSFNAGLEDTILSRLSQRRQVFDFVFVFQLLISSHRWYKLCIPARKSRLKKKKLQVLHYVSNTKKNKEPKRSVSAFTQISLSLERSYAKQPNLPLLPPPLKQLERSRLKKTKSRILMLVALIQSDLISQTPLPQNIIR